MGFIEYVINFGFNFGFGNIGVGVVGGLRSFWVQVFIFYFYFIVCNEIEFVYGCFQYVVKVVLSVEFIFENCVVVIFLVQCVMLFEDVFEGVDELNIYQFDVFCYEDVGVIDWSQYDQDGGLVGLYIQQDQWGESVVE